MSEENKRSIRISVRNLVEFVLRSGDIDNRRSGNAQKDAMLAGGRIHRKIQKRMGSGYRAEVPLKHEVMDDEQEIVLSVEGRADGIFTENGITVIDEIKGMYTDVARLEAPIEVHLAQAMCYGYFYCCDKDLDGIRLQLTYCNLETEEIRRFQTDRSKEELEQWFSGVVHEYFKWARYLYHHELTRDASIRNLEFPYPYREGQRDLVVSVYRTISRKKRLFIQAPTGIGKTLSTVFPAVRAIGEGKGDKLFYLTAKTVTRTVAEEALRILRGKGLIFTSVTITAKEKLCPLENCECNPDACPYAKGHFDRVNEAVFDILHLEQEMTREKILEYAEKYKVCPFEYCLDISSWTDGIICDYNYVFDPNVRLKRYFADGQTGEYLFLVDEAHNLVSRAREMYSAELKKEDILTVKRLTKGKAPKLTKDLEKCNQVMLAMKRECETWQLLSDVTSLAAAAMAVFSDMETFLEDFPDFEGRDEVLDFYFGLRDFLNVYELLDDHYRIYAENVGVFSFKVRLFCVDPSSNLSLCMAQGNSTILFSATMLPIRYYKTLLSGNEDDYAVYANSPFAEEKRLLMVATDVSSRYSRRSASEYRKVAEYIREVVRSKNGNYMVFFPSYRVMEEVHSVFSEKCGKISSAVQSPFMSEEDREVFLKEFDEIREESFVGFCVMGGIFSEGIDLPEDKLIGVIIVGTGLPQVCNEREIVKQYFSGIGSDGFEYAYLYPGMNKVLQSAGRVIRTEKDRGLILLLDERFSTGRYRELFPREWSNARHCTAESLTSYMQEFWEC